GNKICFSHQSMMEDTEKYVNNFFRDGEVN
ncbi:unnamed protein product, partial [marine sediment metagenome]